MNKDELHKYVLGTCDSKEEERVEHWLGESHKNKKIMEEYKHILEVSPGKRIEVDTYKAWDAFSEHYFLHEDSKKGNKVGLSSQHKRLQGAWHQRMQRPFAVTYAIVTTAVVLLVVIFYQVGEFSTPDASPELVSQVIATDKGQRTTVLLSDGTRIQLNAESRLRVAADYNVDNKRIVFLEGEALFEVASDKQRPFEVHTARSVTQVLGTKFNVCAYPEDENVQVVVAEGKVALRSGGKVSSLEVQLTGNQKGTISRGGEITASKVSDLGVYLDWSRGRLTFRDTPVKEMAQRLERWFAIEVTIAEGVTSQTRLLTGSFKEVPLSSVLHSIALSLDLDYRREGRTVIFEKR